MDITALEQKLEAAQTKGIKVIGDSILDSDLDYDRLDIMQHIPDDHLLKRISTYIAQDLQIPVSTVFMCGLGVFASQAAKLCTVRLGSKKPMPLGLFVVAEQPSGSGKTQCLSAFQSPFYKLHKDAHEALLRDKSDKPEKPTKPTKPHLPKLPKPPKIETNMLLAAYYEDLAEHKATCDSLTSAFTEAMAAYDQEMEEYAKAAQEAKEASQKVLPPIFVSNSTPEGLESILAHSDGHFAAVSSEQGLFTSLILDIYAKETAKVADVVLYAFDGEHISTHRVSRKAYVGPVRGGIVCFAQSGSIGALIRTSRGTGLSERFIMLAEKPMMGNRTWSDQGHDALVSHLQDMQRYADICADIYATDTNFVATAKTRQVIRDKMTSIEHDFKYTRPDGGIGRYFSGTMRGLASKLPSFVLKMAALLQLLAGTAGAADSGGGWDTEGEVGSVLDDKYVSIAMQVYDTYLDYASKLCATHGDATGDMSVKSDYECILKAFRDDKPKLERDIIQSRRFVKPFADMRRGQSKAIRECLKDMVDHGMLIREERGKKVFYSLA